MRFVLRAIVLVACTQITGCLTKGDTDVESREGEQPETCTTVCQHLSAATFGDCAKWSDYQDCVFECEDHNPTQEGLVCAANAGTCEEFRQCDSTYDIF